MLLWLNLISSKVISMEQIPMMLLFTERHPELLELISHYMLLRNSEAIEIHYKNGMVQVWSYYDDVFVTVKDPVV